MINVSLIAGCIPIKPKQLEQNISSVGTNELKWSYTDTMLLDIMASLWTHYQGVFI